MEQEYTLIWDNGTLRIVQETPTHVVSAVFLTIIFMFSLMLNVFLTYVLVTSVLPRRPVFNYLLLNLTTACTLDCLLDMSATLGILVMFDTGVPKQNYSHLAALCKVNAVIMQVTSIAEGSSLAGLIVERSLVIRRQEMEDLNKSWFMKLGILLAVWGYPVLLVLPVAVTMNVAHVRPFADRYSCGMIAASSKSEDFVYHSFLLALGYMMQWIVMLCAVGFMASHVSASRRRRRQLEEAALHRSSQRNSNSLHHSSTYQTSTWSQFFGTSEVYSWDVAKFYVLVVVLVLLYTLLLVPHILSSSIYPFLPPSKYSTSSSSTPPELKPVHTGIYDRFFIWGRYQFTLLVPIVVLCVYKEVRKKCENTFCCCCCYNGNSIMDLEISNITRMNKSKAALKEGRDEDCNNIVRKNKEKKEEKYVKVAHYRTPVLFATSEGLHLRLVDQKFSDSDRSSETSTLLRNLNESRLKSMESQFACEFCDLGILTTLTTIDISASQNLSNSQRTFGASLSQRTPHVFRQDPVVEPDLRLSDNVDYESSYEKSKERKRKIDPDNKKIVRFAQTVYEIPVAESGSWSPQDQNFAKDTMELLPYSNEYNIVIPAEFPIRPNPPKAKKRPSSPPMIRS